MATGQFYEQKIRENGAAAAAKYAEVAQQPFVAQMIEVGVTKPIYHQVSVWAVNEVFKKDGPEVAARFARLASGSFDWVAKKIEADQWSPDHKKTSNGDGAGVDQNNGSFNPPVPKFLRNEPRRTGKTERSGTRAERDKRRDANRAKRHAAQPMKGMGGSKPDKRGKKGRDQEKRGR